MNIIEKAKNLEALGEKEKAAELYLKASLTTNEIWTAAKAGELYYELGNIKTAKEAYKSILDCGLYPLYDYLIDFYLKIGEFKEAVKNFNYCYPFATRSKKLLFADKLFDLKAYSYAKSLYLSCVESISEDKNPYFKKLGSFNKVGFFQSKKLIKADNYFISSNYKSALPIYSSLIKNNLYAKTKTAECYFSLKDYENAKKIYRELVQETDDSYYMFMLAECYNSEDVDVNTLENAVYWYEYSLQLKSIYPYYHLGICYQFGKGTAENLDKAIEMFKLGALKEIDKANCLCKLGNVYYNKGDIDKATSYYKQAAGLGNSRALLNIAITYFENEISIFSYEEILCFLAKAASLGSKRALEMLNDAELANA